MCKAVHEVNNGVSQLYTYNTHNGITTTDDREREKKY